MQWSASSSPTISASNEGTRLGDWVDNNSAIPTQGAVLACACSAPNAVGEHAGLCKLGEAMHGCTGSRTSHLAAGSQRSTSRASRLRALGGDAASVGLQVCLSVLIGVMDLTAGGGVMDPAAGRGVTDLANVGLMAGATLVHPAKCRGDVEKRAPSHARGGVMLLNSGTSDVDANAGAGGISIGAATLEVAAKKDVLGGARALPDVVATGVTDRPDVMGGGVIDLRDCGGVIVLPDGGGVIDLPDASHCAVIDLPDCGGEIALPEGTGMAALRDGGGVMDLRGTTGVLDLSRAIGGVMFA